MGEDRPPNNCTLLVGPNMQPFRVNKAVMATASSVLNIIFATDAAAEGILYSYKIPAVKPGAFQTLIDFVHTKRLNLNTFDEALDLYCAARVLNVQPLAKRCGKFMCSNGGFEKACVMYEAGKNHHDFILMKRSLKMIKCNIKEILLHKCFEEAELETVATILTMKNLSVTNREVLQALERYALAKPEHVVEEQGHCYSGNHTRLIHMIIQIFRSGPQDSSFQRAKDLLDQYRASCVARSGGHGNNSGGNGNNSCSHGNNSGGNGNNSGGNGNNSSYSAQYKGNVSRKNSTWRQKYTVHHNTYTFNFGQDCCCNYDDGYYDDEDDYDYDDDDYYYDDDDEYDDYYDDGDYNDVTSVNNNTNIHQTTPSAQNAQSLIAYTQPAVPYAATAYQYTPHAYPYVPPAFPYTLPLYPYALPFYPYAPHAYPFASPANSINGRT